MTILSRQQLESLNKVIAEAERLSGLKDSKCSIIDIIKVKMLSRALERYMELNKTYNFAISDSHLDVVVGNVGDKHCDICGADCDDPEKPHNWGGKKSAIKIHYPHLSELWRETWER